MYCQNCGKEQEGNPKYCHECGTELLTTDQQGNQQQPYAQQTYDGTYQPVSAGPYMQKSNSKRTLLIISVCVLVVIGLLVALFFSLRANFASSIAGTKTAEGFQRINIDSISMLVSDEILDNLDSTDSVYDGFAFYDSLSLFCLEEGKEWYIIISTRLYEEYSDTHPSSGKEYMANNLEELMDNEKEISEYYKPIEYNKQNWKKGKYKGYKIYKDLDGGYDEAFYFEVEGDDSRYYEIFFSYSDGHEAAEVKEMKKNLDIMIDSIDKRSDDAKDIKEFSTI